MFKIETRSQCAAPVDSRTRSVFRRRQGGKPVGIKQDSRPSAEGPRSAIRTAGSAKSLELGATAAPAARLAMIVLHDDASRAYAYARQRMPDSQNRAPSK